MTKDVYNTVLLRLDISGIPLAPVHPYSEGSSEKTPVNPLLDLLTSVDLYRLRGQDYYSLGVSISERSTLHLALPVGLTLWCSVVISAPLVDIGDSLACVFPDNRLHYLPVSEIVRGK